MARDFATERACALAAEWDEQQIFPVETLRKAAELGFAGDLCARGHRRHRAWRGSTRR